MHRDLLRGLPAARVRGLPALLPLRDVRSRGTSSALHSDPGGRLRHLPPHDARARADLLERASAPAARARRQALHRHRQPSFMDRCRLPLALVPRLHLRREGELESKLLLRDDAALHELHPDRRPRGRSIPHRGAGPHGRAREVRPSAGHLPRRHALGLREPPAVSTRRVRDRCAKRCADLARVHTLRSALPHEGSAGLEYAQRGRSL